MFMNKWIYEKHLSFYLKNKLINNSKNKKTIKNYILVIQNCSFQPVLMLNNEVFLDS